MSWFYSTVLVLFQFETIHRLNTMRKEQMKIFKQLTMFQQRIVCHRLPKSFDCITVENIEQQCKHKQNKIIQEMKRQMLNVELEQYERKLQDYEHLYQRELAAFERHLFETNSGRPIHDINEMISYIKTYLHHQTNKWMRHIRYSESCLRIKLLRHSRARSKQDDVHVYPQIIIDTASKVPLNQNQLNYLSYNGKLNITL